MIIIIFFIARLYNIENYTIIVASLNNIDFIH